MANTSRIFGFRPVRHIDTAPYNGQTNLYAFSSSETTAAYKGDLVKIDTTNRSTSLTDAYAPGIPFIMPTGSTITTTVYRGVIAGFIPQPEFSQSATASLGLMYRLASTARYAWVVDDPMVIFEVEETGTNSYTSASNNAINKLIDVSASGGTPNATTGISGYSVVGSSVNTTNLPIRILRATQRVDNFNSASTDTTPAWHWDVMFANSDLSTLKTGA